MRHRRAIVISEMGAVNSQSFRSYRQEVNRRTLGHMSRGAARAISDGDTYPISFTAIAQMRQRKQVLLRRNRTSIINNLDGRNSIAFIEPMEEGTRFAVYSTTGQQQ